MAITNGYATLNQLKSAMRIPLADTTDDSLLETAIESASRQIDGHCQRRFYSTSATRVFIPADYEVCETDDIISITTLKTLGTSLTFDVTWEATDYQLEPLNGVSGGIDTSYTNIRAVGNYRFLTDEDKASVQITGVFGWSAVPTAIEQATIILAQRQFKRYDSPLGVAGFGDLGVIRVSGVDPDVARLIAPYRRIRMA